MANGKRELVMMILKQSMKWVALIALLVLLVAAVPIPHQPKTRSMYMAEFSLQALHDEIENDPQGLGYKNVDDTWKGDDVIAGLINAKNYKIDRMSIEMEAIRAAVTYDAYNNLSIDEQEWILVYSRSQRI
jgi:hypothetical protein